MDWAGEGYVVGGVSAAEAAAAVLGARVQGGGTGAAAGVPGEVGQGMSGGRGGVCTNFGAVRVGMKFTLMLC